MSKKSEAPSTQIDTLLGRLRLASNLKGKAALDTYIHFARRYLVNTETHEVEQTDFDELAADVERAWCFVQERKSSRPLVNFEQTERRESGRTTPTTTVRVLLDDKPFVVDSIRQALLRCGATIKEVRNTVLFCGRKKAGSKAEGYGRFGELAALSNSIDDDFSAEAFCSITTARIPQDELKEFENEVRDTLQHVSAAVSGYREMTAAASNLRRDLLTHAEFLPVSEENVAESIEFIGWLVDNHFTFLGYEKYRIATRGGESVLQLDTDSLLGVSQLKSRLKTQTKVASLPGAAADFIDRPKLLSFAKSSMRSKVHRPAYYDYVLVKEFDKSGQVTHMHRFLGLYTSSVYFREALAIPLLRKKVSRALDKSGFIPNGHNMKDLLQVINTFPRDELFQVGSAKLLETAVAITRIKDTGSSRIFIRKDFYGRFVSCLVYIPRELFNTDSRLAIQALLQDKLQALDVDFNTYLSESSQARIHLVFRVPKIHGLRLDAAKLEAEIEALIRPWEDDLLNCLRERNEEEEAQAQFKRYAPCFSAAYKETYSAQEAVSDLAFLDSVTQTQALSVCLSDSLAEKAEFSFKLFSFDSQLMLSDVDPILENLGLRIVSERTFALTSDCSGERGESSRIWLHDFLVYRPDADTKLSDEGKRRFEEAFYAIWDGRADDDAYNALLLSANLEWRQAALLRALGAYLKQIRFGYSQLFLAETLSKHAGITAKLVALFEELFSPEKEMTRAQRNKRLRAIEASIEEVSNLSEDSVLRGYLELILAMTRSNYFQQTEQGIPKDYFSFKFEPRRLSKVPRPVPKFEIFVYSRSVEGVHLRGGKVARGGLRWSDRREDYRTEVLGLVKAQQVKNSVIVPVGAKGGFVLKGLRENLSKAEFHAAGVAAYKVFIAGLLDLTDNLIDGSVEPPRDVRRLDEDDPYLVVAADKGTATFSDTANGIAQKRGFWLGDAFASGGSNGYDHKAMGITAKGAWVSVQRHFRELNINVQKDEFSVVGIGDMSGDVFGNGMLLSDKIKLVGAFNHLHVFVDPAPCAKQSFKERRRLFKKAGSNWADYDATLISKGGGVFERSAKSIKLTQQMKALFDVSADTLTPDELISAMLCAPVDLLWNGGIGTYVKAAGESHESVGDKANDGLRVDAQDLRCIAVGEGGNLGLTQKARIEFGLRDGRIFTDFVDNSAGVDCSDHEVNIKILLNELDSKISGSGRAKSSDGIQARNELLKSMTQEVSDLVLDNNYKQVQTLALSFTDESLGCEEFDDLVIYLEDNAELDRKLEFLPDSEALKARAAEGGRPARAELAVATSVMKMHLKEELVQASYLNDPHFNSLLNQAFPRSLVERFEAQINAHPLRNELMATQLANRLVNRVGAHSLSVLLEVTGKPIAEVVRALYLAIEILSAESHWQEFESLDYKVASHCQDAMMLRLVRLVRDSARWLLRNCPEGESIEADARRFMTSLTSVRKLLPTVLTAQNLEVLESEVETCRGEGVPPALAKAHAEHRFLLPALGLIETATEINEPLETMAGAYYIMGEALRLDGLADLVAAIVPTSSWDAKVRSGALDDLLWRQKRLARRLLTESDSKKGIQARVDAWFAANDKKLARTQRVLSELQAEQLVDLAMVTVVMRELKRLS